jgi:hypothetical protein
MIIVLVELPVDRKICAVHNNGCEYKQSNMWIRSALTSNNFASWC